MKRIVIKKSEWGGATLINNYTGHKCCLGFACLALGHKLESTCVLAMPYQVGERRFDIAPSEKLLEMVKAANLSPAGNLVADIAAAANDSYHYDFQPCIDRRPAYLAIMRQCFKEAGLVFVLRKDL